MGEYGVALEDHGHIPLIGWQLVDLVTVQDDMAFGGEFKTGDEAQRGRLATAGRAQQGDEAALFDIDTHVVDGYNTRVQIFDANRMYADGYGSHGNGAGQFRQPTDIAIDAYDRCYVVDVARRDILMFDDAGGKYAGAFIATTPTGQNVQPIRITIDPNGELLISGYPIPI